MLVKVASFQNQEIGRKTDNSLLRITNRLRAVFFRPLIGSMQQKGHP
jgi:hypothetical protein